MSGHTITEITVTPIPVHYRKELGKNAYGENVGNQRTEWPVRARTDGSLEGLSIANRFMREFNGFDTSEGTIRGLCSFLNEVVLGRQVDEFLDVSDGRVVGVRNFHNQAFSPQGWLSILAFDLLGRQMGISCLDLLGGRVRDKISAYDTTLYFQDLIHPERGGQQVAMEAAASRGDG